MRFLILIFLPLLSFASDPIPLFDPPSDWECAFPDSLASCIQVGFLGKGSTVFRPSINLATEEVDVTLKEYLKSVKEIHLANPGTTWRDLGKFKTRSGEGRLTEITSRTPAGDVRMLQTILVKGKTAYILTGAAIKDDFLRFQEAFTKSFQSLNLTDDLFSYLPVEKKQRYELLFTSLGDAAADDAKRKAQWDDLQKLVLDSQEMGNYWQFLVLKAGREKIYQ